MTINNILGQVGIDNLANDPDTAFHIIENFEIKINGNENVGIIIDYKNKLIILYEGEEVE